MENLVMSHIFKMLSTYKGKRVFITGHTGFKGSWLLKVLNCLDAEVVGYALDPNTNPNLFSIINGKKLCKSIIGDIRDIRKLHKTIIDFQPDFVFHLAAQPLVRISYQIPAETFDVNAIGTANVLDGIRFLEKPCIGIMVTTDKVYQNNETGQAYKEDERLGGYDPYSASKACAELVIDSYRKSFFNPKQYVKHQKSIASVRAGNVIGGGDWATDRLVPDIVRSLSDNKTVQIRNPKAVRPWQHILEPLSGYLTLGIFISQNPVEYAGAFNFGPYAEDVLTVQEMASLAIKIWGNGNIEFPILENQPHEASLLCLDISKATEKLKWKPKWNAQQALEYTLNWYKAYYYNENIDKLMYEQINNYFE
jgi:CDP-glucose 4,6-dehydratase